MKRLIIFFLPVFAFALAFGPLTGFKVTGKITGEDGHPLADITVQVKGTAIATKSGKDGNFTVTAVDKNAVLVFSCPGYWPVEEKINGRESINVELKVSYNALQEVVVTANGVTRKRDITSGISAGKINRLSAPLAMDKMLQGKASGIVIRRTDSYIEKDEAAEEFNTEDYDNITENRFLKVTGNPLSTFSIDVDAASYSNVRRYLNLGQLPPAGAVRIEEMINYFRYDYPAPVGEAPISVNTEIADCPWNQNNKLVLIGLQGRKIPVEKLPASNFVFLIDVSGSMQDPQKLPLVQASMKLLVDQLREQDHIALVVYAGAAGLVLPSTSGDQKIKIKEAIDKLEAGGSTAGGAGIKLAYKTAKRNFVNDGNNRVILCTDGDFNVGASSDDDMERLIEQERKSGVFLTVLGYGMGNYKDNKMQKLADKGNGNHAYIDGINEAKKVLVNEFGGSLFTIAKDVKLQIEFNPAKVQGYRLVGYENRMLRKEDFNNDNKDAGDMGSGHTVTALYEVIPAGVETDFLEPVDPLKYQSGKSVAGRNSGNGEMMNIKLRYKMPDGDKSRLLEHPVYDSRLAIAKTSCNFRFAAAVAQFGLLLRDSEFKSNSSYDNVLGLAKKAKGNDVEGYRSEFIRLVESARSLAVLEQGNDDNNDVSVINE